MIGRRLGGQSLTKRPPHEEIRLLANTHLDLAVQNPAVLAAEHLEIHSRAVLAHLDSAADFPRADDGCALGRVVGEESVVFGQQGGEEGADFGRGGFAAGDDAFGLLGFLEHLEHLELGGWFFGEVGFFISHAGGCIVGEAVGAVVEGAGEGEEGVGAGCWAAEHVGMHGHGCERVCLCIPRMSERDGRSERKWESLQ